MWRTTPAILAAAALAPSGKVLRRQAGAGASRLTISRPRVALGRYRVGVSAVDAAGNRSATQLRTLTVR